MGEAGGEGVWAGHSIAFYRTTSELHGVYTIWDAGEEL